MNRSRSREKRERERKCDRHIIIIIMSGATIIAEAFGENANLYREVLGLCGKDVSASQLRKAYYKRALQYHPDKQQENDDLEDAKLKFQAVSFAYNLLSDPERRQEYDETGELNDNDDDDDNHQKSGTEAWTEYFRGIFGTVSTEDIDKFTLQYKCSEEEEKDVLKYYIQFKGNLDKMLECVMCSQEIDKKRWVQDYIQPAIQNDDTIPDYTEQLYKTMENDNDKHMDQDHHQEDQEEEVVIEGNIHEDSSSSFMEEEEEEEEDEKTESEEDESEEDDDDHHHVRQTNKRKRNQKDKTTNNHKKTKEKVVKKTTQNNNNNDLIAAIRGKSIAKRQEAFDTMLMGLEERYASTKHKKSKKKTKKNNYDDIPDDEFEKIRSNLGKRRRK